MKAGLDVKGRVGIAVVGAGNWGRHHVRNFVNLPGAHLHYVCDPDPSVRAGIERTYPGVRAIATPEQALEDPAVAGVVIATPATTHHALAMLALAAGKDLLVEKPLALHSDAAAQICQTAARTGRVLMVGHLLLYHPAVELLKHMVDQGELGDVLHISCQRLNLGVVRKDENAWWSLAPHDISVADHLLGQGAEAVNATGTVLLQPGRNIEDIVMANLQYPGNRIASVQVSWLDPHKIRRITVVGSRKMAVFDDMASEGKLVIHDKGAEPPAQDEGPDAAIRVRSGEIRLPALTREEPLRRECSAFVEAVLTRRPPLADGRSGLQVVRALEAGAASLKRQGAATPVEHNLFQLAPETQTTMLQ